MLKEYAEGLAMQMGLKLDRIVVTEGRSLGCLDAHLLSLCIGNKLVSEFIYQSDVDMLATGTAESMLQLKINAALSRLQVLLDP